jgi:two-component system, OmpR family, sensor histidine kinase ChvG
VRLAYGIRPRLLLVALVLLTLPWLAAQFIASMERFLRQTQEEQAAATARVVAAALSDRPALFERAAGEPDKEAEERRPMMPSSRSISSDGA